MTDASDQLVLYYLVWDLGEQTQSYANNWSSLAAFVETKTIAKEKNQQLLDDA